MITAKQVIERTLCDSSKSTFKQYTAECVIDALHKAGYKIMAREPTREMLEVASNKDEYGTGDGGAFRAMWDQATPDNSAPAMGEVTEEMIKIARKTWNETRSLPGVLEAVAPLIAQKTTLQKLRELVNEQAGDDFLWFVPDLASEAYLQQELRRLHAAVKALSDP